MPVEVRELLIQATVLQESGTGSTSAPQASANNGVTANEELIKLCVDKVLEILREKYER